MKNHDKGTEPDMRRGVTLAAVLSLLQPHENVFILHRISPHELEAIDGGTVQELRAIRFVEMCGDCKVERLELTVDDITEGWTKLGKPALVITISEQEAEPVFIVEGDGFGRYVTDEREVITGRRALLSEQNILCEAAFVPHWKNCPEARHFRHGVRESKAKRDAERKAKGQMSVF